MNVEEKSSNDFLLDTMEFSFSRVNYTCLYEFYLHYIKCNKGTDSFYGVLGAFCHSILEQYAHGKLDVFELAKYYEDNFDEIVNIDAPYNKYKDLKEDSYYKCLEYFQNIQPLPDKYEVLGIEKEVHFEIDERPFVGYIDLLLRDKETGEIIIVDHKSGSIKLTKNGQVSKSKKEQEHLLEFKRQLYLYSIPVIEEYGKVDKLCWNLFKDGNVLVIQWDAKEFESAKQWAESQIKNLYDRDDWPPLIDADKNFYCYNLCGQREICEYCGRNNRDEEYDCPI